jgi:hypothetical protein
MEPRAITLCVLLSTSILSLRSTQVLAPAYTVTAQDVEIIADKVVKAIESALAKV